MKDYLAQHKDLMTRWKKKPFHNNKKFIEDGIIDFARWQKAPKKILFFLKEAYGGDSNLCEIIRTDWRGPKYKLWWTAAYWLYAINQSRKDSVPIFPKTENEYDQCAEMLLSAAVINVKKSDGKSTSTAEELQVYVKEDSELLKEQIELICPEIIILGSTIEQFKTIYSNSIQSIGKSGYVYQLENIKVISYWHPANQYPNELCYYALCSILQESKVF